MKKKRRSVRVINNTSHHTTNIDLVTGISGSSTLCHNKNSGPGAGGFNGGDYSGSSNNGRNCEENRVRAPVSPAGGSSQRVQSGGFDQGEHLSFNISCGHCGNTLRVSFNRSRVSSTHTQERKCRHCKRSCRIRRIWRPKQTAVEKDETFEYKTEKEEGAWLDSCAVGCLREHKDILPTVNENLREQGFTFCKAKQMEDGHVLLQCTNNNDLSTLISKGSVLLNRHFQWVKPWSPKVGDERFAYVRIVGVPLHALTGRFFRDIVDSMGGAFISLDDSTINKIRLDRPIVLIRTTSKEIITKSLPAKINSDCYSIKVIEETDQNSAAVDSNWDISDNDGAVVDGRLDVEKSDGDSSDKGFKEIIGREKEMGSTKYELKKQ